MNRKSSVDKLERISEFLVSAPALLRAFDMELVSGQRLVSIIFPPFIKLARKVSASSNHVHVNQDQTELLEQVFDSWTNMVNQTVSGTAGYRDRYGSAIPVMGENKYTELVCAMLDANIPEVRLLKSPGKGLARVSVKGYPVKS